MFIFGQIEVMDQRHKLNKVVEKCDNVKLSIQSNITIGLKFIWTYSESQPRIFCCVQLLRNFYFNFIIPLPPTFQKDLFFPAIPVRQKYCYLVPLSSPAFLRTEGLYLHCLSFVVCTHLFWTLFNKALCCYSPISLLSLVSPDTFFGGEIRLLQYQNFRYQ